MSAWCRVDPVHSLISASGEQCGPMEPHYAGLFNNHSFADAEVLFKVSVVDITGAEAELDGQDVVCSIPAHLAVVTQSPYFAAQVSFLDRQKEQVAPDASRPEPGVSPKRGRYSTRSATAAAGRSRSRSHDRTSSSRQRGSSQLAPLCRVSKDTEPCRCNSKPALSIMLEDCTRPHQSAVTAVIATMYCVDDAVSSLPQEQLPLVVQYADLLQLNKAMGAAAELLIAAADSSTGLTAATLAALASLPAWPDCLLPLVPKIAALAVEESDETYCHKVSMRQHSIRSVLVAALGNLEHLWQSQQLRDMLLQLPQPALQLLLSASGLTLYSEDTVLYTALQYINAQPCDQQEAVAEQLAQLVRVQFLSDFQLSIHALTSDKSRHNLFRNWQQELREVMLLRRRIQEPLVLLKKMYGYSRLFPKAPRTWHYWPRNTIAAPEDGIKVTWQVPIDDIKQACLVCKDTRRDQKLSSPCVSPPINGTDWKIEIVCGYDHKSYFTQIPHVSIGVYAKANTYPEDVHYGYNFRIAAPRYGISTEHTVDLERNGQYNQHIDMGDYFGVGVMTNGWDQAAWVAKGLPVEGTIDIELSMLGVC